MYPIFSTGILAAFTIFTSTVTLAGADAISARTDHVTPGTNLVVYYGQGYNQSRLREYCDDDAVDIFPIAFVTGLPDQTGDGYPVLNFGNSHCDVWIDPTTGKRTGMFDNCQDLIEDIRMCQRRGKKILLSIGGASYLKMSSQESAKELAKYLWQAFGRPGQDGYSGARPFGSITIDGFDFDIENAPDTDRTLWGTLASDLRSNAAATGDHIILSAAPQCVVPDLSSGTGDVMGPALHMASFDYVWIQFYNTPYCSAKAHFDHNYGQSGSDISFDEWMNWLQSNSYNKDVKAFIGLPASPTALADLAMYLFPFQVRDLIREFGNKYAAKFGGVMLWEATKSAENKIGTRSYAQLIRDLFKAMWPPVISITSSSTTTTTCYTISSTVQTVINPSVTTTPSVMSAVSNAPATTTSAGHISNTTVLTNVTSVTTTSCTTSTSNGTTPTIFSNTSIALSTTTLAPPYRNNTSASVKHSKSLSTATNTTGIYSTTRTVLHHTTSYRSTSTSTSLNGISVPVLSNEWNPWPVIDPSSSTTIKTLTQSSNSYAPSPSSINQQTKSSTSIPIFTASLPSHPSPYTTVTVITTFHISTCLTGYTVFPVMSTLTTTIDPNPALTSIPNLLKPFTTALADISVKSSSRSDPYPSPWPSSYLSWSFSTSPPSSTSSGKPKSSSAPGTGPESIHGSNGIGILTGGASSSLSIWSGNGQTLVYGLMGWVGIGVAMGLL